MHSVHTLCYSVALVAFLVLLLRRWRFSPTEVGEVGNSARIKALRAFRGCEIASALINLFDKDGAGAWPPKAKHDSWPTALRPYKDIYLELVPMLSTAAPSLDDNVNNERRNKYRSLMRKLLNERISIAQVEKILATAEAENWKVLPRDAYNGFYCCIAVCRHAYRWATIPVVKVAQLEKIVNFPPELDSPWRFLQRNFGMTADSGNNTSNVLLNYNEKGERVYKINVGMSDLIQSSEEVFFRTFYNMEVLAFPIYYSMARAIISFEDNNKESCLDHLEHISLRLRQLLVVFYKDITESGVSHAVWLSYVQGFQGWGVGRMVDGEFIMFDGISGSHVLFFQALDAFLGMDRYLTDEEMTRYIPANQRELCIALKKHSFRNKLKGQGDLRMENVFEKIVKNLKVFRAAHRSRAMPYLEQPAPERLTMTAGKSVLEGDIKDALKALDQMLARRLEETV